MINKHLSRTILCSAVITVAFIPAATRISNAAGPASPAPRVSTAVEAINPAARQALETLQRAGQANLVTQVSRETGVYGFVQAPRGGVLIADKASANPESRALDFLATHGALFGMTDPERAATKGGSTGSNLQVVKTTADKIGSTHVKLDQFYRGLKVFGAQLIVHMNDRGITGVSGNYVPKIDVSVIPARNATQAAEIASASVRKQGGGADLRVINSELSIYPMGLLEGAPVRSVLAYAVEVSGPSKRQQVWVDAQTGSILISISLRPDALHRTVYSPQYDSSNPSMFVIRDEGGLPVPPVPANEGPFNHLYDFSGQTYNLYASGFGRDSFDGAGAIMRTVYLINENCPNAYWDGSTTNYCPAFDADDVVSHEWGHAYTERTHGLVYAYQSGALNESYSDIFGETVDLLNGHDDLGGANNAEPFPNGQRWGVGEDLGEEVQTLLLRDMWDPDRLADPGKVSSPNYACGAADGGGVHTNSGVPNHAYALMVDGGTYNGQTIVGIGLTRAAAIYFRAMTVYQTPTTTFAQHEQALRASCNDLVGDQLNTLNTNSAIGTASPDMITLGTCEELGKAMDAVEMSLPPSQCGFAPLLAPGAPGACSGAQTVLSEDWEDGNLNGWTLMSVGVFAEGWPDFNWVIDNSLPQGRPGSAVYAFGGSGGTCGDPNDDYSGRFSFENTDPITVQAGYTDMHVRFDHFVQTESDVDGGNLQISVNGGAFQIIPQENYEFNAPNSVLRAAPPTDQNTNPKAGERAWSGSDIGSGTGSFGTSVVDLSSFVQPGQTFKLRWDFGLDGCGGSDGWYVDNIRIYNCPVLTAPTLTTGLDYENPDTNGSYTLNWTRPVGASGPDVLQVSKTSCAPLLFDNAEAGLTQWTTSLEGTGTTAWRTASNEKPQHTGTTFHARGTENGVSSASLLTHVTPIAIPNTGTTTLRFLDWDVNEGDDKVSVEVSENGTTWTQVYSNQRSELAPDAGLAFATEPLFQREVSLTSFAGKNLFLRFRYAVGAENRAGSTPFGWYVDDITIANDSWTDVATTPETTMLISGQGAGTRCYRVRTTYTFGTEQAPSPFSNPVTVDVAAGPPPTSAVSRRNHNGTNFDIDLPLSGRGIECRSSGNHQVIFNFPASVNVSGAAVEGSGNVNNFTPSGSQIAVDLTGVQNAQNITVNLTGVSNGSTTGSVSVRMGTLLGDTTGNGFVSSTDVSQTKANSGQPLTINNFRTDVNTVFGTNATDIQIVKTQSGTSLAP